MTKRGKVRVETDRESPRTYDVGRNEEVTVRTRHERPEVTGGGGGGGSDVGGALGCLGILIIVLIILAVKAVDWSVNVVEVNIVKKFDPNYKTRVEVAEEKKKEEAKKEAYEIALENAEDLEYRQISKNISAKKIEDILGKKGYIFRVEIGGFFSNLQNFCVLDNFILVCGDLLCEKDYYCPAIVISEDGGNDYRLLRVFKETGNNFIPGPYSFVPTSVNILFLDKNIGYISIGARDNNCFIVYTTNDGGYNWNIILDTRNLPITRSPIKKIRVANQNIHLIIFFKIHGCPESIVSNDSGKSWTYKYNNKGIIETFNGGLTWEATKSKK